MLLPFNEYSRFKIGDMTAVFLQKDKQMLFSVYPASMESKIVKHQENINHETALLGCVRTKNLHFDPRTFENMIQIHIQGDAHSNFYLAGDSMVNNETARTLEFVSQDRVGNIIKTVMKTPEREIYATQTLTIYPDKPYFSINTEVENKSNESIILDQLSSFVLGMISPFACDDGNDRYYLHRRLAFWSAEGKLKSDAIEDLGLERSWQTSIGRVERFGQRSSMAVKKYFPFAVVEDRKAGAFWGVQLCAMGPWQLELMRRGDFLNLAGGMTDKEFSNFEKTLAPNEKIKGIEAIISVAEGSIDKVMNNLARYAEDMNIGYSPNEEDMPIIYNDWCSNWGIHTEEKLLEIADFLKGRNIKYFVVDAGWFAPKSNTELNPQWAYSKGDWAVNSLRFPNGMRSFCNKLRERGFIPGIWFEMEQVNFAFAEVGKEHPEYFVQYHGVPYTTDRMNWVLDFRKKEVRDFMHTKVTDFLIANNIRYMKTDYNYTMNGADSSSGSEQYGLYEWFEGVKIFFNEIKERIPDLTLEICASGGHRLTPQWMSMGDMASITDAHENVSIPLIASEVAMQIPMRSNQVWVTMRNWDDEKRFKYLLAGGCLGRLCFSGHTVQLSKEQVNWMEQGIKFYEKIKPLVKKGTSKVEKYLTNKSWNTPEGYQIFVRENDTEVLAVVHTFGKAPTEIEFEVGEKVEIKAVFKEDKISCDVVEKSKIKLRNLQDFSGVAVLLKKDTAI